MTSYEKMRYFLELSYKGSNYNGWQRQNNAPSVQQTIESALSTILRTPTAIVGAGRTDTGVHAAFYVAHFDTVTLIDDCIAFSYHLNAILPLDIAINRTYQVRDEAHARFDAISREYKYHVINYKNPFSRELAWQYYVDLNVDAMNIAAAKLLEYKDFTSFSKLHSDNKTNICNVSVAHWTEKDNELVFTIRADRFLRNMVRAIVGTLTDVGRGRISIEEFEQIIIACDLKLCRSSAPAQGLFLTDVQYPETITK